MNFSHEAKEETQSGWFARNQTTLLPAVVWYRDKDGVLHQEYRRYVSDDRRHNNRFVQQTMEELISHYASIMESKGLTPITHVHIWSDGCGGQFKNRWQLYWLSTSLKATTHLKTEGGTPIHLEAVSHHFFAPGHGKGPCDSCGAYCKTTLRNAIMSGIIINTSHEAFMYLKANATIKDDDGKRMVHEFVWVSKDDVKQARPPVKLPSGGMNSMFSFIGRPNKSVEMCEGSCTCLTCLGLAYGPGGPDCRKHGGKIPQSFLEQMELEGQAAREVRTAARLALDKGKEVLEGLSCGALVVIYVEPKDRRLYAPGDHGRWERAWDCQGRYRLAQLAEPPPAIQRSRVTRPSSIKVFLADEEEPEHEYSFPSPDSCLDEEGNVVMYDNCQAEGTRTCEKKHCYEVPVTKLRLALGPRRASRRRGVGIRQAERYRLTPEEIEAVDDIMIELAEAFPHDFPL